MSAAGIRAARAYVEVSAKDLTEKGLTAAERRLRATAAVAKQIGRALMAGGALSLAPIIAASRGYVAFSDSIAEVRTVAKATRAELQQLTRDANRLGTKSLGIAPTETATAQIELAKGGVGSDDIRAMTKDVLEFKTAAGKEVSTGDATTIGLDTLKQFELENKDFSRIADGYVAAANASTTSVRELADGMKYAAPAAHQAKETFEQTAAALAVLAEKGVKGEQGGTALRNAFTRLADAKNRAKLKDLTGVSATDDLGNLKPMAALLVEIGSAIRHMPSADRLGVLDVVFGERAMFAATGLGNADTDFKDMLSALQNAKGESARVAAGMADSLGGDFRRVQASTEALGNSLGAALDQPLRSLAQTATNVIGTINDLTDAHPGLIRQAAAASLATIALGGGLWGLGAASNVAAYGFGPLKGALRATSTGLGAAAFPLRVVRSLLAATNAVRLPKAITATATAASKLGKPLRLLTASTGIVFGPLTMAAGLAAQATGVAGRKAAFAANPFRLLSLTTFGLAHASARGAIGLSRLANLTARYGAAAPGAAATTTAFRAGFQRLAALNPVALLSNMTASTARFVKNAPRLTTSFAARAVPRLMAPRGMSSAFSAAVRSAASKMPRLTTSFAARAVPRLSGPSGGALTASRGVAGTLAALGRAATRSRYTLATALNSGAHGLANLARGFARVSVASLSAARRVDQLPSRLMGATRAALALGRSGLGRTADGLRATRAAVGSTINSFGTLSKTMLRSGASITKGGFTAAGGLLKTAFNGVLGVAGSVLSPSGLLIAGLAATAAGIVYATGGFDKLRTGISAIGGIYTQVFPGLASAAKGAFSAVKETGATAFNAVQQQIAAGDWMGAATTAWSGVKAVWADIVNAFAPIWAPIAVVLEDVWAAGVAGVKAVWGTAVEWFGPTFESLKTTFGAVMDWMGLSSGDGAQSVSITWADAIFGLQATFLNLKTTCLNVWNSIKTVGSTVFGEVGDIATKAIGRLAKLLVDIPGIAKLLGASPDDIKAQIDAMTSDKLANRAADRNNQAAQLAKEREDIEKAHNDRLAALEAEREKRREDHEKRIAAKVENAANAQAAAHQDITQKAADAALKSQEDAVQSLADQRAALGEKPALQDQSNADQLDAKLLAERAKLARQYEEARAAAAAESQNFQTGNPERDALEAKIADLEAKQKALYDSDPANRDQLQAAARNSAVDEMRRRFGALGHGPRDINGAADVSIEERQRRLAAITGQPVAAGAFFDPNDKNAAAVGGAGGLGKLSPAVRAQLGRLGVKASDFRLAETTTSGTFSARAAAGMAGTSVTDQIAEHTKRTAASNDRIAAGVDKMANADHQAAVWGE